MGCFVRLIDMGELIHYLYVVVLLGSHHYVIESWGTRSFSFEHLFYGYLNIFSEVTCDFGSPTQNTLCRAANL